MKSLSSNSIATFLELINQLGTDEYRQFNSEGYMPLSFELIGKLQTTFGNADAYRVAHFFTQSGDLMRDPEMCFLLMPTNLFNNLPNQISPYSYRLDPLGSL